MGSVYPLLAVREKLLEQKISSDFIWVGTEDGPERDFINQENILYFAIKSGKLRRYFSRQNFVDPFRIIAGIFQSLKIIKQFKPDIIITAGSFVSVPLFIAARFKKVKTIVHQQDVRPGMANKFMAKRATRVTVAFVESLPLFPKEKTVLIGNPVRATVLRGDKERGMAVFSLERNLPTLLVMGGSSGAEKINELLISAITALIDFCQIIHITGADNIVEWIDKDKFGEASKRYHSYEYLRGELADAYCVADLVVCRAGLSTLTELATLGKPSVVIPIPGNQQEENATYFARKNAIIVVDQKTITRDGFISLVNDLLLNPVSLENLSKNIKEMMPTDANAKFVELITSLINESKVMSSKK